ncbi:MAG: aspartyl protease family protein [Acidobacteriota bacterium]
MTWQVEYQRKACYQSLSHGITIETILRYGGLETSCNAKVDTGAEVCLFERSVADTLDIEVENGYRERFSTLAGGVVGYAHPIELETVGLRFQTYVYFAESYSIRRSLLGRQGWLQLVRFGLDDYRSELYLSANS